LSSSNATPKNCCNRSKMVAIDIMPGNRTILNCHRPWLPCHPVPPWGCVNVVPPWGCGDAILSIVMKYVYIGKKNQKNKNYVDYSLKYAPPTSTKALLPLHYLKFCVFPLHPTFLNLVLPPANCSRAQLGLGRSCHAAAEPRPAAPWPRPAATSLLT
jgi:hypothetical protein